MREKQNRIIEAVKITLPILLPAFVYLVVNALLHIVFRQFLPSVEDEIVELLCVGLLLPLCFGLFWRAIGAQAKTVRNGIFLLIAAICVLGWLLFVAAGYRSISAFFIQVLCVGIVGPINEELLYRGCVLKRARKYYGGLVACVYSAALFAVAHMRWQQILPSALIGFLLAVIMDKTNRITIPILLHICWNLIMIFV